MSKMLGRIGDLPLIRFDTYTCGACAVSCTLKWDVATVMEYKGLSLQQVVDYYVRGTMQNIRRQLLSIISQYKLFTNLYQCLQNSISLYHCF
jgi:isoaspartyl peptidase/L-asparaginase-like protein (Ntn-hydrolase superfamily)